MIVVTRFNGPPLAINCDLIEHIEMTPDTVISMTTGQRITVLETTDEVIKRVIEFRRQLRLPPETTSVESRSGE